MKITAEMQSLEGPATIKVVVTEDEVREAVVEWLNKKGMAPSHSELTVEYCNYGGEWDDADVRFSGISYEFQGQLVPRSVSDT